MKKALLSRRGNSRSTKAGLMLAAAAASFAFNRYATAITGTWLDTNGDSNWSEPAQLEHEARTPPGNDTGSTINGDTAWFDPTVAVSNATPSTLMSAIGMFSTLPSILLN